jgi:hypothetical protein
LVVVALVASAAGWAILEALTGAQAGFLYLAPALLMVLPLVMGRYVGEDRIAALAGRSTRRVPRRRATRVCAPRSRRRVMWRGGQLVGRSLAKRPPPLIASLA